MIRLPNLYAIVDTGALERRGAGPADIAEGMLEGGVRLLQFRHKGHFSRDVYEIARRIGELCREAQAVFVIDDRADIAALLGAGVHVGQDDLAPRDVRKVTGASAMVGFSTHNEEQLAASAGEPVSYLAIGPVFSTGSKQNPDPALGAERIATLRTLTAKPLVAIGGITLETAPALLAAGIDSVAVIGDLLPVECTRRMVRERVEHWLAALADMV